MRAAFELAAPGLDELALAVEDHHRVGAFTRRIHGVVHVDVALRILHDAVRVPVRDRLGQFAPIVMDLVGVSAASDDWQFHTRLVIRPQNGRRRNRRYRCCFQKRPPLHSGDHITRGAWAWPLH